LYCGAQIGRQTIAGGGKRLGQSREQRIHFLRIKNGRFNFECGPAGRDQRRIIFDQMLDRIGRADRM
jgi:hypothetical protein